MISRALIPIRVRYSECDPMNVAHHSSFLPWLEIARTELLRLNGMSYAECERRGVYFVVARLNIRYRRPARYDDELQVEVELEEGAQIKLVHQYRVLRGEELIADAQSTLVCVDRAGTPRPVPELFLPQAP